MLLVKVTPNGLDHYEVADSLIRHNLLVDDDLERWYAR
jgi:hypothetical protein